MKTNCYLFFLGFIFLIHCKPSEPVLQQPLAETDFTSGFIYAACDFGPYYLKLDSIVKHCSENQPLPEKLETPLDQTCLYDDNEGLYGTSLNHDLYITRDSFAVSIPDVSLTMIPLTLDDSILDQGEFPYYYGLRVYSESQTITLYFVNKFVGGCFHDMIIWEIETFEK